MYVAGGAALHLYTGQRLSDDIDASFSHRIALPDDLEVAYADADGAAKLLYFDRQYNDTLGLLHEDAYEDSQPLDLRIVDRNVLDVRLLSPPAEGRVMRGEHGMDVGERVKVRLVRTDPERGYIDFERA